MSLDTSQVLGLAGQVSKIVAPVTLMYTLEGATSLVPLWAAGRYRTSEDAGVAQRIGAVGLGLTVLNSVALIVRSGWTGGQDALVSQAFGKRDFALARVHLHECQIWMTLWALIIAAVLCSTKTLLLATRIADEKTAYLAQDFVCAWLPGLWFEFQYDSLRKFLLNQKLPTPGLVVLWITAPTYLAVCHVLLEHSQLGVMRCLGLALAVKSTLSFILLAVYVSWRQPVPSCYDWWRAWKAESLSPTGLLDYAKFGAPSTAMVASGWMAWSILTFMAGGLRDGPELAAHVAATGASEWLFMLVRGTPKTATALVGAAAGAGDRGKVRAAAAACGTCCLLLCSAAVLGLFSCRQFVVAWLLPESGPAQKSLASLFPLVALQLIFDATNSFCEGVFAGLGHQWIAAAGIFACYWVVQLPLAYFLAYHVGLGVWGIRVGGCASGALGLLYNILVMRWALSTPRNGPPPLPVVEYAAMRRRPSRGHTA